MTVDIDTLGTGVRPLELLSKTNEIIDAVNGNLNMHYATTNPVLTPVAGICTWTVTHNLHSSNINCSLYKDDLSIICNVEALSNDVIIVSFNASETVPAGTYKVVVISNGSGSSGGGGSYTLPVASTTTLGGVKIDGTSINIDENGVISSAGGVVDSTLSSTSTNPVQNKVINTALNNKLNTDASNLSSTGQKVFDGQWVKSSYKYWSNKVLTNTTGANVMHEIDMSSHLPNDNYFYEVRIAYWFHAYLPSTIGQQTFTTFIAHNFIGNASYSFYLGRAFGIKVSDLNFHSELIGNTIVVVSPERKIKIGVYNNSYGECADLSQVEYRRLGTNQ